MTIITRPSLFRASAPFATLLEHLGPLAELPGTWVGNGFNLISLPDFQNQNSFQVKLNATQETLTFTPIGAPIPDRGFKQQDIFFEGLHYVQQVSDATTGEALHIETGMWLHVPETTDPSHNATVVRLSTIPHGDSLLAQGHAFPGNAPFGGFPPESVMPFTLPPNQPPNVLTSPYTDPITNAQLPPNIPSGAIINPNVILDDVLIQEQSKGVNMVKATNILVAANPVGGIQTTQPKDVGGIVNIPFIQKNAKVQNFAANFSIETMENPDNSQFLQLQYSQTVLLQFEINPGDNLVIHWPHVSVGTLVKQ